MSFKHMKYLGINLAIYVRNWASGPKKIGVVIQTQPYVMTRALPGRPGKEAFPSPHQI